MSFESATVSSWVYAPAATTPVRLTASFSSSMSLSGLVQEAARRARLRQRLQPDGRGLGFDETRVFAGVTHLRTA